MIGYFLFPFIATFILTRVSTHILHKPKAKKAYTITWLVRNKTRFKLHHIHLGFLLILISPLIYFISLKISFIFLGIGLSLIADQILPLLKLVDYFELEGILSAIILHILIGGIMILIL